MTDIYIVNQSSQLNLSLTDIVPALQEQVSRDFAPLWGITATIYAAETVPQGAWAILLIDESDQPNSLGYHINQGVPLAKIGIDTCLSYNANPTITISHELLEMLADPLVSRKSGQYLMEIADPVTGDSYQIGNISVSNFVTPRYYGLTNIGHFDQLGKLSAGVPQCTYGGMIMWWDGEKYNQTFARTEDGQLSWRAHVNGRSFHRASK